MVGSLLGMHGCLQFVKKGIRFSDPAWHCFWWRFPLGTAHSYSELESNATIDLPPDGYWINIYFTLLFPDLWSGQKPWWNWYVTPVVNFSEVRRAQLAKSTLLTSTLVPRDLFRSFKVCSDAKERVGYGKQREATHLFIPGKTAALDPTLAVKDLSLGRTRWWWWWLITFVLEYSTRILSFIHALVLNLPLDGFGSTQRVMTKFINESSRKRKQSNACVSANVFYYIMLGFIRELLIQHAVLSFDERCGACVLDRHFHIAHAPCHSFNMCWNVTSVLLINHRVNSWSKPIGLQNEPYR